jgi:hypothetical protein
VLAGIKNAADFTLRLAFFAIAPLLIVLASALFPVTGALVTIGLAVMVFVFGEAVRGLSTRWPILGRLLKGQLEFEAYYRQHTPRPFLYYVFYPFLFPYWLWVPQARREFWLFKGYTLFSVALLVGGAVWQFRSSWQPELGLAEFFRVFVAQLVVETLLVLMLVMPIVTTVVKFHATGARARLGILLGVAIVSSTLAVVMIERRRDPIVSYATRERVRMRSAKNPKAAHDAQLAALRDAWAELAHEQDDIDRDGKVEGEVLDAAHQSLEKFYKADEAFAFDLWFSRSKAHRILVVYFEARGPTKPPIFLALDEKGHEIKDAKSLPKGALGAMKHAADGMISVQ